MSRIVIAILIYHRHKLLDLTYCMYTLRPYQVKLLDVCVASS
jgi:hypothetical protein